MSSVEFCDHCNNSSCANCDDKYYGGLQGVDWCSCDGYHY